MLLGKDAQRKSKGLREGLFAQSLLTDGLARIAILRFV